MGNCMVRKELTEKEKIVFYNLIVHPDWNDRMISDSTGIKLSTVTAIRRRLKDRGFFSVHRIPNLKKLGVEIIAFIHQHFPVGSNERYVERWKEPVEAEYCVPTAIASREYGFTVVLARNYTHYFIVMEKLNREWEKRRLDIQRSKEFLFPTPISTFISFFNYRNIVSSALGLEFDADNLRGDVWGDTWEDVGKAHGVYEEWDKDAHEKWYGEDVSDNLSLREKAVLLTLIEHPETTDREVGEIVGISRQSVASIKYRFKKMGLYKEVRIPSLQHLGYEILAFAHSKFNPLSPLKDRKKAMEYLLTEVPQFFMLSNNSENFLMAAVRGYNEYVHYKDKILSIYREHNFIVEEPEVFLVPLSDVKFTKSHKYAEALRRCWGLNPTSDAHYGRRATAGRRYSGGGE